MRAVTEPGTPHETGTPIPDEVCDRCKLLLCTLVDEAQGGDQYALARVSSALADYRDLCEALTHRCGRAIGRKRGKSNG